MKSKDLLWTGLAFLAGYYLGKQQAQGMSTLPPQTTTPETATKNYGPLVRSATMNTVPMINGGETVYYRSRWGRPKGSI